MNTVGTEVNSQKCICGVSGKPCEFARMIQSSNNSQQISAYVISAITVCNEFEKLVLLAQNRQQVIMTTSANPTKDNCSGSR